MDKTLVTGSNGLVGSQFKGDIIQVSSKVCDLRDSKMVDD